MTAINVAAVAVRPDTKIEEAVCLHSYEQIVVLTSQESTFKYPEEWVRPAEAIDLELINAETVVVVDRVEISKDTLLLVASKSPRLVAMSPATVDQEKLMRRMITSLFPWAEVWTIDSSFGKLLVTNGITGEAYDHDAQTADMRSKASA